MKMKKGSVGRACGTMASVVIYSKTVHYTATTYGLRTHAKKTLSSKADYTCPPREFDGEHTSKFACAKAVYTTRGALTRVTR